MLFFIFVFLCMLLCIVNHSTNLNEGMTSTPQACLKTQASSLPGTCEHHLLHVLF